MHLKHKGAGKWIAENDDGEQKWEFKGTKDEAREAFEAWLSPENPEAPVELPNADELRGSAKTAALNAEMPTTFVAEEWKSPLGVQNESNAVFNVPDGWRVCWSTSRQHDGGAHANYLRSRGYRPVLRDEMADDMYGDGMYCAYIEDDTSGFVFMNGSQLFTGYKEKLDKIREHEYREHMSALEHKSEETQEAANRLGGAPVREVRESSPYNPMRG